MPTRPSATLRQHHYDPTFGVITSGDPKYGIEVEVENYHSRDLLPQDSTCPWRIDGDGSLRNYGAEFIAPSAFTYAEAIEAVDWLWPSIESGDLHANVRTGVHVHVNCLDYTQDQIKMILLAYAALEPAFFQLALARFFLALALFALLLLLGEGRLDVARPLDGVVVSPLHPAAFL